MTALTLRRQLFDVDLEPISGSRFQPTGFPDIGASVFKRPERVDGHVEWVDALLVESAQSVANHLEGVGWDRGENAPVPVLAGLPYVRVVDRDGNYLTSSRTEAHRLASAFVKDSTLEKKPMLEVMRERLGLQDDTPLAPREIAAAIFALDPMCLVHGVFFADKAWPGQPKIARALTGFVEAIDVRDAVSGGVKRDEVRHSIGDGEAGASEGYGPVPFHRTEWTAAQIVASFSLDLSQIAAYGLGPDAEALLVAVARWEIRSLLDGGLRLRTACDLVPIDDEIVDRAGAPLPAAEDLGAEISARSRACADQLGVRGPLDVEWKKPAPKSRGRKAAEEEADTEEE